MTGSKLIEDKIIEASQDETETLSNSFVQNTQLNKDLGSKPVERSSDSLIKKLKGVNQLRPREGATAIAVGGEVHSGSEQELKEIMVAQGRDCGQSCAIAALNRQGRRCGVQCAKEVLIAQGRR